MKIRLDSDAVALAVIIISAIILIFAWASIGSSDSTLTEAPRTVEEAEINPPTVKPYCSIGKGIGIGIEVAPNIYYDLFDGDIQFGW